MSDSADGVLELASAVADGTVIDWSAVLNAASSDAERAVLEELALVAALTSVQRTLDAGGPTERSRTLRPLPCVWGPLLVEAFVGRGSFGAVYRARDTRLDRIVALKLVGERSAADDEVLREGRLLARVQHPNVVTIYGGERSGGYVGLWMEFVEGRTLAQEVRDDGELSPARVVSTSIGL